MRLLHIYSPQDDCPTKNPLGEMFPDAELESCPIDCLEDVPPASFDLAYCAHTLTEIEAHDVPGVVRQMAGLLRERGELWLAAPALEWVAEQIRSESPSPAVHIAMLGDANHPARSGFTLAWLRQLIEQAMLVPRRAYHSYYQVAIKDQTVQIPLAVCVGWKVS